ncbi:hypothetical protein B0H11DRAFT_2156802 [Mycena galericulata]|nr:hypothetical protein B0H11DRAFT_2156802 [Mycena galericulata]
MGSNDGKNADGDDLLESPQNESPTLSSGILHMYPLARGNNSQPLRSKRRQVKNACTNCQKACKKCDEARPCLRCVKYGVHEECMDSTRRERKKGGKRGPYKKRDGKGNANSPLHEGEPELSPQPDASPTNTHAPGFYAQFPLPPGHKPGETAYYPQFYLAPVPAPPNTRQEGEATSSPTPPQFIPATFMASYPPYIMHPRPDGQMVPHYPWIVVKSAPRLPRRDED